MVEAALPRGTGQKKDVFEGLPALTGPPEMLEGEVESKRTPTNSRPLNSLGHTGHQVNLRKLR